ncbi:hypothetical protein [Streptomyces sp. NPDC101166]|uniref:hypothetical protein n=1 Tax=Streptomyces sp. NPDC101166 TaxID=3366120 RepID=UPI003824EEE4
MLFVSDGRYRVLARQRAAPLTAQAHPRPSRAATSAGRFLDIALKGPGHAEAHPGSRHFCTELHSNDGVLGNAREIHIEYCEQWAS